MVAMVLLNAPTTKDNQGPILVDAAPLASNTMDLMRSNMPYVIAGLTVNTNPGLRPSQRPVTPSSSIISCATAMNELSSSFPLPFVPEGEDPTSGRPTCCRVATTDTGMVKIWPRAPATAPSASSVIVD